MKLIKILLIVLCAAILESCCYCQKYQRLYGRPLHKTNWELIQFEGRPASSRYVAVFSKDGGMTVTGPESQLKAKYYANDNGVMTIGDITKTGTPEDVEFEERLVKMLGLTTNYKMDGLIIMFITNGEVWAVCETHDPKIKHKKIWDPVTQQYVLEEQ